MIQLLSKNKNKQKKKEKSTSLEQLQIPVWKKRRGNISVLKIINQSIQSDYEI